MNEQYDIAILGGGPAGAAAAVYAARKKLKTVLITDTFGGQSSVSELIYNWIGTPEISGNQLAKDLEKHVKSYPEIQIVLGRVSGLSKTDAGFSVMLENGTSVVAKTTLYALGSVRRKLEAVGADTFEHKGLTYCATCDGPLFSGKDVVVVGGGNAGFESALQLLEYCNSVTLLHRSEHFRADEITVQAALSNPKFKALKNVTIKEVTGERFVKGINYEYEGVSVELPVSGIFVEIGQIPNTSSLSVLDADSGNTLIDQYGKIVVDPLRGSTTIPGLWAAGDCTNGLYHQNNIAAGDAVKALEDLYIWIRKNK